MGKGLIPILLWIFSAQAILAETVSLKIASETDVKEMLLGRHLYILKANDSAITEQDVLAGKYDEKFELSTKDFPNQGLLAHEIWVRLTLDNLGQERIKLLLESRWAFLDFVTVFQKKLDGSYDSLTLGDIPSFKDRPIEYRVPVFPLGVNPGENTYYVRVKSKGTLLVSFYLWDAENFSRFSHRDTLILGLAFGAIAILFLYNIFLALSFRSQTYAVYCVYLLDYLFSQFGFQGTGLEWFGDRFGSWAMNTGYIFSISMSHVLTCIFASHFLNTKEYMPRWRKFFIFLTYLNLLVSIYALVGDYNTSGRIISSTTLVTSLALIIAGIVARLRGFRPAIFYTIAWTALLMNNLLLTLLFNGLYPMNVFVQWGNFPGGIIEAILISLALGDRINYMQAKSESLIKHLNQELTRHVHKVEAIVAERTETIRSIIDNVKFGFLTVDRQFRVEAGFTRSCYQLLGKNLQANILVTDLLQMEESKKKIFRMSLQQVFEDQMHEDVALTQIPKIHRFGPNSISLEGSVVRDNTGTIKAILFTIADVSRLQKKRKEAHRSAVLLKLLRNMDSFRSFILSTRKEFADLKSNLTTLDRRKINFLLHTLKGNSLVFGLRQQARLIHDLEEKDRITGYDISTIEDSFRQFTSRHFDVLKLSWDQQLDTLYMVSGTRLAQLEQILLARVSDSKLIAETQKWIQEVSVKSALSILGPIEDDLQRLAHQRSKKLEFRLEGGEVNIMSEAEKDLVKRIIHLLRNAVIHGIEADRSSCGKSPEGRISLKFAESEQFLAIEVKDDGRGFDIEQLRARAISEGLLHDKAAKEANLSQLMQLLSSSEQEAKVTEDLYAGRGVGLSAVYQAVAAHRGTIELSSELGKFCMFLIKIPRQETVELHKIAG